MALVVYVVVGFFGLVFLALSLLGLDSSVKWAASAALPVQRKRTPSVEGVLYYSWLAL